MNNTALPKLGKEIEARNDKEQKVEAIINSVVYGKKANNQIPSLYYLVLWKGYLVEKSTQEPSAVVKHLQKLISTFYKEYPEKPKTTFSPLDSALPMAKQTVPKEQQPKQKGDCPSKRANKRDRYQGVRLKNQQCSL